MFRKLVENHTLTNLTFFLVLVMGWLSYYQMPREQDPSINFNWVQIWTFWPGATATDIEKRITDPLEEGVKKVKDIKFVSSTSREGVSSILVRFNELDENEFGKRVADLRRELQARNDQLPEGIKQPDIVEISSSNAFPTAAIVVWSRSSGEVLQDSARNIQEDLSRLEGVDNVASAGARDPELQVNFLPDRLLGLGISPVDLADTVSAYFQDLVAGDISVGDKRWLVRLTGTSSDPAYIAAFPIATSAGEVPLRSIAEVSRGREDPRDLVRYNGHPAVLLSVMKSANANNIRLLEQIAAYVEKRNRQLEAAGVGIVVLDDQTQSTRSAISVMQRNALIGLLLVVLTTWLFLGLRIALITSAGIPFVLAGTFWLLAISGQTLNVTVLLGIVISLGMLVDDAVVVVEAISHHIRQGRDAVGAAMEALQEVAIPVTTAVLTTIAAFLPLMLLPGILGDFMKVVPIVVSIALVVSLLEAFWMLPAHAIEFRPDLSRPGRVQRLRERVTRRIRKVYTRAMLKVFRRPWFGFASSLALLVLAVSLVATGLLRVDFFATDLFRLFYVNVDMPASTNLQKTSTTLEQIDRAIKSILEPDELRGVVGYAGEQFTDKELLVGDEKGQLLISLMPETPGARGVDQVIDAVRAVVLSVPGPQAVTFLRRKTGPPTAKPVSIKVRGDDIGEIRRAVKALMGVLGSISGVSDISDDDNEGGKALSVRLDPDAVTRARLNPADVVRTVRLFVDGENVASMQYRGEKVDVRVRARPERLQDINTFLNYPLGIETGEAIPLGQLLEYRKENTVGNIRHQNFRRAVTLEAELDSAVMDTLTANRLIQQGWNRIAAQYPEVTLDFSGEMDDIQESLNSMAALFMLGLGLIYLILGTQFKSYIQPFIVLSAVPMAFIGVVLGLFVSSNPLSLYTLYGAIALAGIAANDAIVLIATANRYVGQGWPVATAVVWAARRRVIPILITSLTTMAGLYSLAAGLGGKSLIWGPVATAIVWGLAFSTLLTLFVIPLGYNALVRRQGGEKRVLPRLPVSYRRREGLQRLLGWARPRSRHEQELEAALNDPERHQRYEEGVAALENRDLELAVRCFEALATAEPGIFLFNLYAAQANILLMTRLGWDIGYMARARRYLTRARSLDENDMRVTLLERACQALEQTEAAGQTE